ncbi:MAG: signal recognition particle-docking protein FtsY [Oscillospiraceae bacterium]|nr:signal recognition particle-docking protein FtsY [Oscillospiraceae bacterium]
MGFFEKIAEGIRRTRDSILGRLTSLFNSFTKIDEEFFESLEETLIMCDIGAQTSVEICDELRKKVKEKGITDPKLITTELTDIITDMLGEDTKIADDTKPVIILVIGVNGAGKTTSIGKLAARYVKDGKKVIVAAADTFRAAAIEQLEVWVDRAGAEIVKHAEGSDPAAVVFDAITAAKARGADVLICDTAGRLHNKKNLMDELRKINRICKQQAEGASVETLLVLDATTGQNAVNQARLFSEVADITGIILTKLDGTAKGGIIISIHRELGIPVKLVGVGEKVDDLMDFNAADYAHALFETNIDFEGNYERLTDDDENTEDISNTEDTSDINDMVDDIIEEYDAEHKSDESTDISGEDTEDEPAEDEITEGYEEEQAEEEEETEEEVPVEQPEEEEKPKKKSLKEGRFGFLFKEITFGKKKPKEPEITEEENKESDEDNEEDE